MAPFFTGSVYIMFFLSGAAALVYQVAWVRSLTLIFGGSHFAVTVVLSIFMAGLAIGGYIIGRYVDRVEKSLRLYGLLEIGIAIFALAFMGLMKLYPSIYVHLAQWREDSPLYLLFIRVLFSAAALIVPTTLMGGTLPVLSKFVSRQPKNLRNHLPFLYGLNTLGAVLGAATAGFFLLRLYSVSATLYMAIFANLSIGLASILLQGKITHVRIPDASKAEKRELSMATPQVSLQGDLKSLFPFRLVLLGIGISGFCALGYEVLWTRILTVVVGASVYSFTTMLIAFLTGIALGSGAYGLWSRIFRGKDKGPRRSILLFGVVEIIIGVSALLVTLYIRDLPVNIMRLHQYFQGIGVGLFGARLWSSFSLAFLYMVVPAFFMGLAFPLAGKVYAEHKEMVGGAVGEVLAYNTLGAILGSVVSGFFMIHLFGIERSLQMLTLLNIGLGFLVLFSPKDIKALDWSICGLTLAALLFLALNQNALRIWDKKYFAVFESNRVEALTTPERIKEALDNTDVLYYAEGTESIVSSIKTEGGEQSFLTNGRTEASSHLQAQQCQFTLGHLPMLLHKNPKRVLVVGLGSGMTLGATCIHPTVERLILAELEPKVVGVARTFESYNHHVLESPKLKVVFNDGRNFLMTTKEKFDVITADPIHPWFRGAGYLYTAEYFKLVSDHLLPRGIACQWLPLYELTPDDLKSVVITFRQNFRYTMMWLTHYDAEIAGSNSPIIIDEKDLDRRFAQPKISEDLNRVMMGNVTDFLSYFVMGNEGMERFGKGGIINTDDNLFLEFSAPFSIGRGSTTETNVNSIVKQRESLLPYLAVPADPQGRIKQQKRWANHVEAMGATGQALGIFLGGRFRDVEFKRLIEQVERQYPEFAPARFLKREYLAALSKEPRFAEETALILMNEKREKILVKISAVFLPISEKRASMAIVDNDEKVIYGELFVSGPNKDQIANQFAKEVMAGIRGIYHQEISDARRQGLSVPMAGPTLKRIKDIITSKIPKKNPS
jgi:spermidine synthase